MPAAILEVGPDELDELGSSLGNGAAAVAARRLVFAVSERDVESARKRLDALRESAQVHAAVAGVGSDSDPDAGLDYLVDYPADLIVLAPRLSHSAVLNDGAGAVLGEVCTLAHELGWTTVAQGIHDEEQRAALEAIGIDQISGAVVGGPVEVDELGALLDAQGVTLDPRPMPFRGAGPAQQQPAKALKARRTAKASSAMPPLAAAVTPTTFRPNGPAAAAVAPVHDLTAAADPIVAGGWASQQGKRKRRRPRRQGAGGSVASAGVGTSRKSPAKAAAARYSAQPEGSRRRRQDTPSPAPYSGPAASAWLPILLVLLIAAIVVAFVLT